MTDFQIRSDNVDVEQIMRQIRSRIREKRGVDYTEEEIKELARVKLEKFLDPTGVRSDLLVEYRRTKGEAASNPNYKFEDTTIFETHRGFVRFMRKLLYPILKLFFNPHPLIDALHIQSDLNARSFKREELQYELIHNLVLETTRLGIQVKNLRMQVESMSSRLDFDERRARALEGVVQYRPGAVPPLQPPQGVARDSREEGQAQEGRTRRRRRRGRRPGSGPEGTNGSFGESHQDGERGEPSSESGDAAGQARGDRPRARSTSGEGGGQVAPTPHSGSASDAGPVPPKPHSVPGREGGPVPPKLQSVPGSEGG
ncbi:MAG: hypothetical protein H0W08_14885 [Acidobacteria bacterium]|nr:hypothetical protein [Acidobacteriota bacterium]